MFNGCATIAGFSGLGELGQASDPRPTYDYVRSGDVLRIALNLDTSFGGYDASAFRNALASSGHLALVNLDQSQVGTILTGHTGQIIATVQALNDFSHLADVLSYVAGLAQSSGLYVLLNSSRAEFVSKVEQSGGNIAPTIPGPPGPQGDPASSLLKTLQNNPGTVLLIGGAIALFLFTRNR